MALNESEGQKPRWTAFGIPAVWLDGLTTDGRANAVANGVFDFVHAGRNEGRRDANEKRAVATGVNMTATGISWNKAHRQTGGQCGTVF